MNFAKKLISLVFALHFMIVCLHILAKNAGFDLIKDYTSLYIDPFFIQEWEMFAPPPQTNMKMYYRYLLRHPDGKADTTEFREILEPLYEKQKSEVYSLSRLSYYLVNCSQNLLSQCYGFMDNLPQNIDECDTSEVQKIFDTRIQNSFSFQSIARHAKLIYIHHYDQEPADQVYFSFHFLEEEIPDFHTRKLVNNDQERLTAYNSSFYPINF